MLSFFLIAVFPYLVGFLGWPKLEAQFQFCASRPPYFVVGLLVLLPFYLLASSFPASIGAIRVLIAVLSGLLLFVIVAKREWPLLDSSSRWCLGAGLVTFFLLFYAGPYFELPSDPLSHLERIYYDACSRLSYFWLHLVLTSLPKASTFKLSLWQGLIGAVLIVEILRIVTTLTKVKWVWILCAVSSLCFFGTNLFSYFRYYAFATGVVAYIVYLNSLNTVLDFHKVPNSRFKKYPFLVLAFGLLIHLHKQEALFLLFAIVGSEISLLKTKWMGPLSSLSKTTQAIGFILLMFLLVYLSLHPIHTSVMATLGIPGVVSIGAIFWLLARERERRLKVFCMISLLMLTSTLVYPFSKLISLIIGSDYLIYRLAYGALYWVPLSLGVYSFLLYVARQRYVWCGSVAIVVFLMLGSIRRAPFYGRLDHLVYRVPLQYAPRVYLGALLFIEEKIKNREFPDSCQVYTDTSGRMALMMYSNFPYSGTRFHESSMSGELRYTPFLIDELVKSRSCFVMIRKPRLTAPSWVGAGSGHWNPNIALSSHQVHQDFIELFQVRSDIFNPVYEDEFSGVFAVSSVISALSDSLLPSTSR